MTAAPVKIAAPGLTLVGIEQKLGEVYLERFVNLLAARGDVVVTTPKDISQVLGLERQKELVGCSEAGSSCLAELAGALGVEAILSVSLAKTGNSFTVNLRVLRSKDGTQLLTATERLKSEDALQDWLDARAREFSDGLVRALAPAGSVAASSERSKVVPWVPAMLGGALAIAGGITFGLSKSDAAALRSGTLGESAIESAASGGQLKEGLGIAFMITGGAAIATSVVWALLFDTKPPGVGIVISPNGTAMVFSGVWP